MATSSGGTQSADEPRKMAAGLPGPGCMRIAVPQRPLSQALTGSLGALHRRLPRSVVALQNVSCSSAVAMRAAIRDDGPYHLLSTAAAAEWTRSCCDLPWTRQRRCAWAPASRASRASHRDERSSTSKLTRSPCRCIASQGGLGARKPTESRPADCKLLHAHRAELQVMIS